jgi:hypothetical protein
VEFGKDGRIRLEGTDQFGAKLDQTYENAAYFKAAVPVIARYLKPAQVEKLKALAETLENEKPAAAR